jgi:hypothetical protein
MAIQVGGTTVIDNSRNLQNVTGLKTVNSNSILGSGDISIAAGASVARGSKSGSGTVSTGIANALVYGIGMSGSAQTGRVGYTTDSSGNFTFSIIYGGEVLYWIVVK